MSTFGDVRPMSAFVDMAEHTFQPLHLNDAVTAGCSCGWVSGYSHAFVKYAEDDHDFHVENERADG